MTELALIAKATVILGIALVATRAARRAPASVRALILATAFGLLFVLPIASALSPAREVQIPEAYAPLFLWEDEAAAGMPLDVVAPRPAAAGTTRSWPVPSVISLARSMWVLGVVATLAPLLLGLRRSRAVRRDAREWADGATLASTLRDSMGLHRPVSVVLHDNLVSPMTCGWQQPTIVMPPDSPAWPAANIRQALVHELEHVRRHDWAVHILARFTCALYWFHPAAWMAWRQLALESERACDDAVVARAENAAYAEQLVTLARRFAKDNPVPLLSMADRRTLSTRVAAILSTTAARGRVGTVAMSAVLTGATALAVAIAPMKAIGAQARDALTIPMSIDGPPFEVVSVRPNEPDDRLRVNDWQPVTGRLTLRNLTPKVMLTLAYANTAMLFLPNDRLLGVPEWAEQERFTIEAIAGRSVTPADLQRMLRRVLVERFGLQAHLEQRQQTAYRLTVARADGGLGPNLRPADEATCKESRRPRSGSEQWGPQQLVCITIDLLALDISERLDRPVLNQTGLTGIFDGTLSYSPSAEELTVIYRLSPSELPPAAFTGPSLTTALQEQLGLKLESTRAAIDVLVVDRIDRPTPNDALEPTAPQQPSVQKPTPPAPPQPAAPAFDVTSVRRNTSGDRGARQQFSEGRFAATNTSLRILLVDAFRIQSFQIVGGPEWLESARFDIVATIAPNTTPEQRPAMLRTLLAERFNLRAHTERRQMPIYALVANRDDRRLGPDLRSSAMECSAVSKGGPLRAPTTKVQPDGRPECGMTMGPASIRGGGMTMAQLANALSTYVQRTVVDRTGFEGFYDFDLRYAPRGPGISTEAAAADPRPSIFTAVQEQLGLRLEADTGPVDVLVVDSVDLPTEN